MSDIAILCCKPHSVYKKIIGLDCYDHKRDVHSFKGDLPVIAHPPCAIWSKRVRHQYKGIRSADYETAQYCVEKFIDNGGIIEQPAGSALFDHFGLRSADYEIIGIWQYWFNYPIRKRTWLCFNKCRPGPLPFRLHPGPGDKRKWSVMSEQFRSKTTQEFAEWLVKCVRS